MKQIQSKYRGDHKSIFILPIGDVHFGNRYMQREHLDKALAFAEQNRRRCRIILMGDLLELATKTSVGRSVYDEDYPTQRQFEIAIETFTPFADIIDCVIEGNHEERIIRDTSYEITQEFCHRLGRIDAYGKFSSIVNFTLGSGLTYSAYVWHGATGSTKESGAINAMLAMRERATAHLYFMGHTHKLLSLPRVVAVPQPGEDKPAMLEQLFVNTGTAVGPGGYGEQKGYPMQKIGFGVVEIFADERKMLFHRVEDLV